MAKKEKKEPQKPSTAWQGTYGDMITLMLCFFVMLYNPSEIDITQLATITQSLQMNETETVSGGMSLAAGRLADLGNSINALPAIEKGRSLGDEIGLVITLASDNFFSEASADLNIDETRDTLLRLSDFFKSPELKGRRFRIEGHTDNTPVKDGSAFLSNWELSTARATNVLHYLADYGVNENAFHVAGYADTRPKMSNDTAEGRAYNRRVDIIILDEGHF